MGGVCLNRGCIPTKALLRTAELLNAFQHAADFGIHAENVRLDYPAAVRYRDGVVSNLRQGVGGLLKSQGVQVLKGIGRLVGHGRVEISANGGSETVEARNVIVATAPTGHPADPRRRQPRASHHQRRRPALGRCPQRGRDRRRRGRRRVGRYLPHVRL